MLAGLFTLTTAKAQEMDSLSYALGVLLAQNLQSQGFDNLDEASMTSAIHDVLAGNEPKFSAEEANQVVQQYMMKKQQAKHADAIEAGKAFLAENAKRDEVKVTDSGLQYEVLKEGEGPEIEVGDFVEVEYIGTLEDGTEFDNSYDREQPFQLIVGAGQVIPGWEIGLLKMREGETARFVIPSDLGYGAAGAGEDIPPNATLIFEVEVVSVQKQPEQ